jgi:hypothetical protein
MSAIARVISFDDVFLIHMKEDNLVGKSPVYDCYHRLKIMPATVRPAMVSNERSAIKAIASFQSQGFDLSFMNSLVRMDDKCFCLPAHR